MGLFVSSSYSWRGGVFILVVFVSTFLKGRVCRVLELGRGVSDLGRSRGGRVGVRGDGI